MAQPVLSLLRWAASRPVSTRPWQTCLVNFQVRHATNPPRAQDYPPETSDKVQESSYAQPALQFSQSVGKDEKEHYRNVEHHRKQQMRSPWTRSESDRPPVADRSKQTGGKIMSQAYRLLNSTHD